MQFNPPRQIESALLNQVRLSWVDDLNRKVSNHRLEALSKIFELLSFTVSNIFPNRFSNPSTDDITWLPANKDNALRYLEMKPFSPEMKAPIFGDRLQFWALLTKHYEFDIIRGIHKESLHSKDEL